MQVSNTSPGEAQSAKLRSSRADQGSTIISRTLPEVPASPEQFRASSGSQLQPMDDAISSKLAPGADHPFISSTRTAWQARGFS